MAARAVTRDGKAPNSAGRAGVAAALERVLDEGRAFADLERPLEAAAIRSWVTRVTSLGRDLADCVEAPMRNRVMEILESSSVPDDFGALEILRINVAGASCGQFGKELGISGRTVERVESGHGCHVRVAWTIANHFALDTTEMFTHDDAGDSLRCRTVGELRHVLLDGDR